MKVLVYHIGLELANRYKAPFIEASAFDGTNVEASFLKLGEVMMVKGFNKPQDIHNGDRIRGSDNKERSQSNKKCCKT